MSYLIPSDFKVLIQTGNLNQVTGGDNAVLSAGNASAEETAQEYLSTKYDLTAELKSTDTYDPAKTYSANDRIYLDAVPYSATASYNSGALVLQNGSIYKATQAVTAEAFNPAHWLALGSQFQISYVTQTKKTFDLNSVYSVGDQVYWKGNYYTCQVTTAGIDWQTVLQATYYSNVPNRNIFPDDPKFGLQFWGMPTPATVAPASFPVGWTIGDNRNANLVQHLVSVALYKMHYRISPNNVPGHITKAYMGAQGEGVATRDGYIYPDYSALGWLQSAMLGSKPIRLPLIQPRSGGRIRWGSKVRNQNGF